MNRPLAIAGLVLALVVPAHTVLAGRSGGSHHSSSSSTKPKIYVEGYYRKDGTWVPPHYRAAPGTGGATTSSSSHSSASHPKGCQTCPRDAHGRIIRSSAARTKFLKMTGYPHGRPGYVVDHIVPLECGGADDPSNMQWMTIAAAKAKDRTEGNCRR